MWRQGGRGGDRAPGRIFAAAKISNSVFRLTADAKGQEKVFLASRQLLRPNTYAATRGITRTPGTPEP